MSDERRPILWELRVWEWSNPKGQKRLNDPPDYTFRAARICYPQQAGLIEIDYNGDGQDVAFFNVASVPVMMVRIVAVEWSEKN